MLLQLEPTSASTLLWVIFCAILAGGWIWREFLWKQRLAASQNQIETDQQALLKSQQLTRKLEFQTNWLAAQLNDSTSPKQVVELLTHSLPAGASLWSIEKNSSQEHHVTVGVGDSGLLSRITATRQLWEQLETLPSLQFDPANLSHSTLLRWPSGLRTTPFRLLITRCGTDRPITRLLCTTHLPEWTSDHRDNLQLLEWACQNWPSPSTPPPPEEQVASADEVRMVRIMLELRTIADMDFPSPLEMLREFLRTLAWATGYERVALFLTRHDNTSSIERFCYSAPPVDAGLLEEWQQQEQRLVQEHRSESELVLLDEPAIAETAGTSPLKSCVLSALIPGADPIGFLCLTSRSILAPHEQDQQIITWAARFLLQTLSKTVDRVVVEEQARRDALTRLANRHSFDSELQRQLKVAAATGELCSLVMLDLDHFKRINDTYGHPAGDAVLKEAARRIEDVIAQTRVADRPLVARLGGEELAVLLPGVGHAGALRIAEAIRHAVRDTPVHHDGQEIRFTTSIGIAVCPRNGRTSNELITAADAALYAAKTAGRDRVHTAAPLDIAKPVTPVRDAR